LVLRDGQTKVSYAIHCNGPGYFVHPSESTARIRRVNEGVLLATVAKRFDLELDDQRAMAGIHERLAPNGSYPLSKLIYGYGAEGKMVFAREVAERAELRLDPAPRVHWSANAVSAEAHYERFVPDELLFALAN
jgi:hypothetical protein